MSASPPDTVRNRLGEPCPHLTLLRVLGRNVLKESLDSIDASTSAEAWLRIIRFVVTFGGAI